MGAAAALLVGDALLGAYGKCSIPCRPDAISLSSLVNGKPSTIARVLDKLPCEGGIGLGSVGCSGVSAINLFRVFNFILS